MILPMKKVSILVLDHEKEQAMRALRKLGLVHIDAQSFSGDKLNRLKDDAAELDTAIQSITDILGKKEPEAQAELTAPEALKAAKAITALKAEKKACQDKKNADQTELERFRDWGDMDPADFAYLADKGVKLSLYELSAEDYKSLDENLEVMVLGRDKTAVRILLIESDQEERPALPPGARKIALPVVSTAKLREEIAKAEGRGKSIDTEIGTYSKYIDTMGKASEAIQKEAQFEAYLGGMEQALLSEESASVLSLALLSGYIPEEDFTKLQEAAQENAWGLVSDTPTEEDNVPTKLRNNRFVSLIYPLTDFLGTVPGYFEHDISGWFLGFMLIFFGIIFGDGGYGLLIAGVAVLLIIKAKKGGKKVPPAYYLLALLGGATILWGLLTCTWFGLKPDQLPVWLQKLSLPVISNVNEDRIWYPFWTGGAAGLTTAQNLQIFCFSLALVQLSVAHIIGMITNRKSLKFLGELGALMQLIGMFYVVLTLVVNGEVFGLGLVISGIPVGTLAVILVAVGFVLSFIFGSYEGSVKDSILDSLKNIISILLGVVNVFSDIVSYIRLWAVGLAGAAISATVNEMAGPMFGRLAFIVFAVILLVFGHGLNMILNVLSVIVHGVRLNTLEFSSHLGISWGGHKYDPFQE